MVKKISSILVLALTTGLLSVGCTQNGNTKENTILKVEGRHDPCIVQRAIPVIEAVTAIGILELLS